MTLDQFTLGEAAEQPGRDEAADPPGARAPAGPERRDPARRADRGKARRPRVQAGEGHLADGPQRAREGGDLPVQRAGRAGWRRRRRPLAGGVRAGRGRARPDAEDRLTLLGQSLSERPALGLELEGAAEPAADGAALRRAALERAR